LPAKKKSSNVKSSCVCGGDCHDRHSRLPGLLLMALGLVALPINFGLVPGFEWALAWPLLLVVIGAVLVVRVHICRSRS